MRPPRVLLLALLVACQADEITTEAPPAVTFDAHAWAGGTFRLVSSGFASPDSVRVLLGGTALPVQRLDSVTLEATLPDTAGTFDVQVETGGRVRSVGSVTLHGGLLASRLTPQLDATAMAWPYGTGTFLAGVDGRLMQVDVFSGTLTPMFGDSLYSVHCGWGPWPAGGNAVVLPGPVPGRSAGASDYCRARVVSGGGTVVDSFPFYDQAIWGPVLRLADGSWVVNHDNAGTELYQAMPGGGFRFLHTNALTGVWRMVTSPAGVNAFGADAWSPDGALPIFRGGALDSPPVVRGVSESEAAAFSESGDTLVVQRYVGHSTPDSVFLVRSLTGETLAAIPATAFYGDFAFDSGHPWLYAVSPDSGGVGVAITVFDVRTMQVATVLHSGGAVKAWTFPQEDYYLSLDVWHRRLNVWTDRGDGFSFDLMP